MSEIRPSAAEAEQDTAEYGDGTRHAPATAVLAAARTSHLYTASAAQGAATALIRLFVDQVVLGGGAPAADPLPAPPVEEDRGDHCAACPALPPTGGWDMKDSGGG
ncbi:hypothetical protein OOK31_37645 [Streptomyces sp. NBC_00249]|uniref:hypothetical protein n=1 Tax=Streptomyces sp. NBC_00249 TaxID=2975690 RepID=UPI0022578303|nr:hypothetical protein [Streptomyces sp. NBC_00249]MCX5199538.1 hypothetical protein [Streptomyces sp. NBC_00249]